MRRINSFADTLTTGVSTWDFGDGVPIPLRPDGVYPGQPGPPGAGVPEGGATGQTIRKTADGSTEWFTPTKSTVGLGNVDNTGDYDKPVSDAQAAELVKKVAKGELFINVKDYGAKGNGVADDTAAIQAAEAAAATGYTRPLYFPNGTYAFAHTMTAKTILGENQQRTRLVYSGAGSAIGPAAGQIMYNRRLEHFTLVGPGAGIATSVGLDMDRHTLCHYTDLSVTNFGVAVWFRNDSTLQIPLYNILVNVTVKDGETGIRFTVDGANENRFLGCRIQTMSGTGLDIQNGSHNIWQGPIEGCAVGVKIVDPNPGLNQTRANVITNSRFENNVVNYDIGAGVQMTGMLTNREIGGANIDAGTLTMFIDQNTSTFKGAIVETVTGLFTTVKAATVHAVTSFSDARMQFTASGATIDRNRADSNAALRVNNINAGALGNIQEWQAASVVRARVSASGHIGIRASAPPADNTIVTGEAMFWIDTTSGAAKLMVKAKQADGAVKTGSIPLA